MLIASITRGPTKLKPIAIATCAHDERLLGALLAAQALRVVDARELRLRRQHRGRGDHGPGEAAAADFVDADERSDAVACIWRES